MEIPLNVFVLYEALPCTEFTPNVTEVIFTYATTTSKNTTALMQKPAGIGVEFSPVAQTKYPGSATAIQEPHLDAVMQFFPLTLIHFDRR